MAINWGSLFKQIAIGIAVNIGIQILTDKDTEPDQGVPKLPESDPDKPLPVFWGTHRIGLNIFRDGKIRKTPIKVSKSFLGITYDTDTVGYQYRFTGCSWLGHGTIGAVTDVIINRTKLASKLGAQTYQSEGVPISGLDSFGNIVQHRHFVTTGSAGAMSAAAWFDAGVKYPDGRLIAVGSPNVLGEAGGIGGLLRFYPGDGSHNAPASLAAINAVEDPTYDEPAYKEWAYMVFEDYYLGNSPQLPSLEWVCSRPPISLGTGARFIPWEANPFMDMGPPYSLNNGHIQGDANPAGILYEMLTNRKTGMGIPRAFIYDQDFIDAWEVLEDEGFGLSHMIDAERAGEDDINDVLRHIDAVRYWDLQMGKHRLRLLRPYAGDPSSLPALDASNLISLEYAETALSENINQVKVEFTNVFRLFLKDVVSAQNLAAIQQAQRVNPATVSYMSITRPTLALKVAQRDLRVRSTILGRGSLVGNRSLIQYSPGQLVRITWPEKGLFDKVCRIGEIDYGTLSEGKISATFVEDYWSMEASSYETSDPAPPTVPPSPFIVPTVLVDVALDTFTSITYNLLITDPANAVTEVAYAEQVGTDPLGAYVVDPPSVYSYEMIKNPVYSTRAFWRVTYTDQNGDPQTINGEFPQPRTGNTGLPRPTLSFIYSGTDVVVTASAPVGATGIKFASALNTPPSDATVLAATPDTTGPYAITVAAPLGPDVLHVGAAATDGLLDSLVARIAIPAKTIAVGGAQVLMNGSDAAFPAGRDVNDSTTIEWNFATANLALAEVIDGSLDLDKLSATGIKDDTTFLRGDNTFSSIFVAGTGPIGTYSDYVFVTPSLANGASTTMILDLAKTIAVQRVIASAACWLRVYPTLAALTSDSARAIGTDPTFGAPGTPCFELAPGYSGASLTQERRIDLVCHNGDTPRDGKFYARITNLSGGTAAITNTLRYLPLEGAPGTPIVDVTAGMLYQFDVQALTPVAGGTNIASVPNGGTVGGNFTSDAGGPSFHATYEVNAISGTYPAIRFQTLGGNGRPYSMPSVPAIASEVHLFAVSLPLANSPLGIWGPEAGTWLTSVAGNISDQFATTAAARSVPIGYTPSSGFLYYAHSKAGLWEAGVGSSITFTTATNTVSANYGQARIGGYYAGGFFTTLFNGYIGELRLYAGALSPSDVFAIQFALATKWGVTL